MSFHRETPCDTLTRGEWLSPVVVPRRPPAALARDIFEAHDLPRTWLWGHSKRRPHDRAVLGATCSVMRRRGYSDVEIAAATGIRRPDSYIAAVPGHQIRRVERQLRKAGR